MTRQNGPVFGVIVLLIFLCGCPPARKPNSSDIDIVKDFYRAVNFRKWQGIADYFHPDAVEYIYASLLSAYKDCPDRFEKLLFEQVFGEGLTKESITFEDKKKTFSGLMAHTFSMVALLDYKINARILEKTDIRGGTCFIIVEYQIDIDGRDTTQIDVVRLKDFEGKFFLGLSGRVKTGIDSTVAELTKGHLESYNFE